MNAKALARRLDAVERHEVAAFNAFLTGLSTSDSKAWFDEVLERMANYGAIAPAPANLWTLPQAEKEAFIALLVEQVPGNQAARKAIRDAWQSWRKPERV